MRLEAARSYRLAREITPRRVSSRLLCAFTFASLILELELPSGVVSLLSPPSRRASGLVVVEF